MINNLNILLPEIFLTISIFSALMIGVFIKNSFNLVFNLSSIIILVTIAIIFNNPNRSEDSNMGQERTKEILFQKNKFEHFFYDF